MGRAHIVFGGGVAESAFSPIIFLLVLIAGALICAAPRRKALVAFLLAGILIPMGQVMVLAGVHLPMLRILVLFGFVRLLRERGASKSWLFAGGFNNLDRSIVLLAVLIAINGVILFRNSGAFIYQAGVILQSMGVFLLLRFLIRDEEDITLTVRTLAWIVAFTSVVMIFERITGHSPYAMLGGANATELAHLRSRDDKFRAQGPFGHSILAGTFGAVLVPLFVGLWQKHRKYRMLAIAGMIGSTIMIITCDSSTPVLAYLAGVLALVLWRLRKQVWMMRRGLAVILIILQVVLKHPVWHLMVRIDISGGSSGYHRYMLIDQCVKHFWYWCLWGVKSTAAWGFDMWDTANEYVGTADSSGLIPLILLISILVYGFKFVGQATRLAERNRHIPRFAWALGCALFAHSIAFWGISYWDQSQVGWYALLVMISVTLAAEKNRDSSRRATHIGTPAAVVAESPSQEFAPVLS